LRNGDVVTPNIRDAERLQGFDADWTNIECRDDLVGGGQFIQRKRWWLVGNAVNVRLSHWLGQRLADRVPYLGFAGETINAGEKLPQAAWFDGRVRRRADLTTWPAMRPQVDLEEFLSHAAQPLSLRAAEGFLARFEASNLRKKPGFIEVLRAHVARMKVGQDLGGRALRKALNSSTNAAKGRRKATGQSDAVDR
jgi:DNA (cytosine-5)-methyltransferase 1